MDFERINKILKLNQEYYELVAKPALLKICNSVYPDPFGTPFRDVFGNQRLILDGYFYGFEDEYELQNALKVYLKETDEPGFFYSIILDKETIEKRFNPEYHKYVPSCKIDDYELGPLENVVYSINGTWAFIFSHETHCLYSGPKALTKALLQRIPGVENQVNEFLEFWVYAIENYRNAQISWLYPTLVHMYGEEKAKTLLMAHNLEYLVV